MNGALASNGLKAIATHSNPPGPRGGPSSRRSASTRSVRRPLFNVPALKRQPRSAHLVTFFAHKSAARPSLGGAQTTIGRLLSRQQCLRTQLPTATFLFRRKPAQAKTVRVWPGNRKETSGWLPSRFERAAAPLALIVAPDAGTRLAGASRNSHGSINMRMPASFPASVAWIRAANSASLPSGAHTSWSGNAGAAVRSLAARPSRRLGIERLSCSTRPTTKCSIWVFSRGYGIYPQDHAGHPPHVTVLGDFAARHRRTGEAVVSTTGPFASRGRGATTKAGTPISSTEPSGSLRAMSRHAVVNVLRFF